MPETPAKAGLFRPTFGFFREVIFNQTLNQTPVHDPEVGERVSEFQFAHVG